jgi:acetoin:2,6-dichlorophenolindophenol oxidoreductase subunit beta
MSIMSRIITYREAINEALDEEMQRDENVFAYGLDVADHKKIFGSTVNLLEKYGSKRCFSTPLSEEALLGFGLGAAISGLRPVNIHIRVDFLLLAMNQLVNMVSTCHYTTAGKLKVPLVIRAVIGKGWGQGMQHSRSLQGVFAHIPGLKVLMPATPADAKGLLKSAIRDDNPTVILEHRLLYESTGNVAQGDKALVPVGQPELLQKGKDITLVATSWMNVEALKVAEIMNKYDISVEIINVRSISPLDYELIFNSVKKTGQCIVIDYDWTQCGFSAEVAARVSETCFKSLKSPVSRLGFAPTPCPTTRPLENEFYPDAKKIIKEIEKKLHLPLIDLSNNSN